MGLFSTELKSKTGIVTGGTSGFGLEITKALLQQGAKVSVFSVDDLSKESNIDPAGRYKKNVLITYQDIMEENAGRIMVEKTVEQFGGLDFVIANAGFAIRFEKPLFTMTSEEIADSMKTQFSVFPIAFVTLAVEAAKEMSKLYRDIGINEAGHPTDSGSIVVTLSEAALCPLRDDLLAYASAKLACVSALRTLAATLGPFNIRVNGIAPGFANTEGPKKFYERFPNIKDDIQKRNHLKPPFMHPGSVVPAVMYLLTDNYVTGEVIALDGGYNINMVSYFQNY